MAVAAARVGGSVPAPLFLVSAATVGVEIALTRYFAVAKWSEYGYWVISIVLAGFALSGVAMALAQSAIVRRGRWLLAWLPAMLIGAGAIGFHLTTTNPFNPLQLQNPATIATQLWAIAGYYAAMLPFFLLAGLYVSLCFVLNAERIGRVYGFDLTGAGAGAFLVLGLMWVVHPFMLVPCLLLPLALAAAVAPGRTVASVLATLAVLAGGEVLLVVASAAEYNDFKAIYAPLHTPDARTVAERRSPRGLYALLDDFTERVDTDVSNDAGMLGLPGPPKALGLYRDGNRVAALPLPGQSETGYSEATLAALPYALLDRPRVLLVGSGGGFRISEALALGAASVDTVETERTIAEALREGLGPSPPPAADARVRLLDGNPLALVRSAVGRYGLIDLSGDFLDAAEANTTSFAAEAIAADLHALAPSGLLSIPVSIREFPAYALRMLATVRAGLLAAGIAEPASHVLAIRSAWNVRILVSPAPFDAARVEAARKFCGERSFDIAYAPGQDAAGRGEIFNDLPPVSFESGEVSSGGGPQDAIADEAAAVLAGAPTPSGTAFDLSPITLDRPAYYSLLRLDRLSLILRRLELLPQAEVGPLVNVAVLAQAAVIALIVLAVPLLAGARIRAPEIGIVRPALYFAALGLGFLFLEIFLIDRASFYLADRTSAFALVLTAMLICSGLGSMAAHRFADAPARGMRLAAAVILAWCAAVGFGLQDAMLATLAWPYAMRAVLVLLAVGPVSVALGLPFPLGLSRVGPSQVGAGGLLPWAWGLNGAFSVVATPAANLIALAFGAERLLFGAAMLYAASAITFPVLRKRLQWQDIRAA